MDKVQQTSSFNCNLPLSEPFNFHKTIYFQKFSSMNGTHLLVYQEMMLMDWNASYKNLWYNEKYYVDVVTDDVKVKLVSP